QALGRPARRGAGRARRGAGGGRRWHHRGLRRRRAAPDAVAARGRQAPGRGRLPARLCARARPALGSPRMILFLRRDLRAHPGYMRGVRGQFTVAMGIAAWGLMTGVAMVQSGLSPLEAVLMTLIVYAGSAQLAAVPMMVSGAPLWVILAAAFCV